MISFKHYVLERPYHFGRGSKDSWQFIAAARGDANLPNVSCWRELRAYLDAKNASEDDIAAAKMVWSSYQARKSRLARTQA